MSDAIAATAADDISPAKLRQVVIASAAGTVFEWYDFFVYGAVASLMSKHFFSALPDSQAFVFTLLTFAVGFLVRPIGALVFGKLGDSAGRKGAFLITILIMGAATFAIGLLPTFAQIGIWAPVLLIACRILQGFALGGEYAGAVIYVAEHAPQRQRGLFTGGIQTSASIGLIGALGIVLLVRSALGEEAFVEWGWRLPFLVSAGLLAISVWVRMQLGESPAFARLREENALSKRAYAESFLEWPKLKIVLLSLLAIMIAQGVVWYTAHFYAQFFMERILKLQSKTVNELMIVMVLISAPLYLFFAWASDKIGRKPIMLFGMLLMLVSYFPGYHMLMRAANPELDAASKQAPAIVRADPADCSFQLDILGTTQFATACDIAKSALAKAGVSYSFEPAAQGANATIQVGQSAAIESISAEGLPSAGIKAARAEFEQRLGEVLKGAGYPAAANPDKVNFPLAVGVLVVFVIAATALYGPQAAAMVELFPTRIRYTAMALPYNVGTGWFGGLLPAIAFSIVAATGNVFAGLWWPAGVTAFSAMICLFFLPETKDRDIHA